jgi:hypothetical protein
MRRCTLLYGALWVLANATIGQTVIEEWGGISPRLIHGAALG